jgi:hypothetical protein
MNVPGDLRTAVRVTLVLGAGIVLAALLMLADPDLKAPVAFIVGLRVQAVLGCLVLGVGVALWFRRLWARTVALVLLRAGTGVAVAWYVYAVFAFTERGSLAVVLSFLGLAFWLRVFHNGVTFLNTPSVLAQLESRVQ